MDHTKIKECVLIDCISFTTISLIISSLACFSDMTMPITPVAYLQLFVCTTLISIAIYFTYKIQIESQIINDIITLLEIAAVVFGVGGGIFKWFDWKLQYVIEVAVILVIVFIVTNGIMIWQNNEIAKSINKKIKER